jgi:hypothetical protein
MKVIVFTNDNGGVSIMTPVLDSWLTIEQIGGKDIPLLNGDQPRPYLIIDGSELPDRQFRDRWVIQDGKVVVKDEVES